MKTVTSSIFLALIFSLNVSFGQEIEEQNNESNDTTSVLVEHETPAEFPGGSKLIYKFIVQNMQYPDEAKEKGIEGRVTVQFTIEKTGEITDIEVKRGVSPSLEEEAVRIVSKFPNWEPATENGKPVKSKARMPISFRLP